MLLAENGMRGSGLTRGGLPLFTGGIHRESVTSRNDRLLPYHVTAYGASHTIFHQ